MKQWMIAAALAVAGYGCDDGGSGGGGGGTPDAGAGQAQQGSGLFGRITDHAGQPVAGARVAIGDGAVTTAADGSFQLAHSAGAVTVHVTATGHLPLIRNATVQAQAASRFDGQLIAEAPAVILDADAGGAVDGERSARVVVPAGALVDAAGAPASGMVDVHLTPIDPSVPAQLAGAPGALDAQVDGGPTKLESFGMLDVTIRQGGSELQVAPGQALQIQIPAPMGLAADPPAELPLWSFDEDAGLWVQEGALTYDAGTATYQGAIAHMSFWNADRELETTCIKGTVTDADGAPIAGAQITARGVDYTGIDTAASGADGTFAVLVRVSSQVNVLAAHGGGVERAVASGDQIARQPADPSDPACVDGGAWVIEREVVRFADGREVDCDPSELLDVQGCIPLMVDLATCHNPQGACEYEAGGGIAATNYRFENGARVSTDVDLDTFLVTTTYYGPGGVECGTQQINTMGASGGAVQVSLPDGRTAEYGVDYNTDSGAITYTCGDGSTRVFTQDQQLALQACTGGNGDAECSGEPGGGGGVGGQCDADAECADSQVCCAGICIGEDLCFLGGRQCEADAECSDGRVCCPVNGRCTERDTCVQSGWCQADADCGDGLCCDQQCVNDGRATCAGACEADADCGGDAPYCCQSTLRDESWCARDAYECYEYVVCEADADCAASGLTCCDGECRSFDDCFSGQGCEAVADCGGDGNGLLCCDSDVQSNRGTCSTPTGCYEGTPCNAAEGCPADLFCCTRFQLDENFEGACVANEGTCNVQLPCGSQAECGEGGECCADDFLPEPMCLPVDSGCTTTLP